MAEKKNENISFYDRIKQIPAIGLLFALLYTICISTGVLIVKLLPDIHTIELAFIRSALTACCYFVYISMGDTMFRAAKGEFSYLLYRCFFGTISVFCVFIALRMAPLGDVTSITYSAPVFTAVFAHIYLREKCDPVNCIAVFATVAGVLLIAKPTFLFGSPSHEDEQRIYGCIIAFAGMFSASVAFISIRKLQNTATSVVVLWFSVSISVSGFVVLVILNEVKMVYGVRNILLVIGLWLTNLFGQLFLTLALKLEEAAPVTLVRTINIVLGLVYQVTLTNEVLQTSSLVGAAIVFFAVLSVAIKKWYSSHGAKDYTDIELDLKKNVETVAVELKNYNVVSN